MKRRTIYACTDCGGVQPKWFGRCPQCGAWNSASEEVEESSEPRASTLSSTQMRGKAPIQVTDIVENHTGWISTGLTEVDRTLGGGILPGVSILLGGEPGIGKSTLLLQICDGVAQRHGPVLYTTGEESLAQIKLRADRTGIRSPDILIKAETRVEEIIATIRSVRPQLAVVDSIQTTHWGELGAAPGSVGQVRDCSALLIRLAKETGIPVVLVGQVTKEGSIAGPKVMEHLVDAVVYFEGDQHYTYRILRVTKNRFGSTHEIGVFEMTGKGLREVSNASVAFLGEGLARPPGSLVTVTLQGNRPLLLEVQALVTPFHGYGIPRRTCSGGDPTRLAMILAVLEKRLGIPFGTKDVFMNVTGGIRLDEPAADLAVAVAIVSSDRDQPLPPGTVVFGEMGLSGEIRGVKGADQRVAEACQLGFTRQILPAANMKEVRLAEILRSEPIGVESLIEAIETVFSHESDPVTAG
ncbi:MAG: DNA repair protein RadA [bacterium]